MQDDEPHQAAQNQNAVACECLFDRHLTTRERCLFEQIKSWSGETEFHCSFDLRIGGLSSRKLCSGRKEHPSATKLGPVEFACSSGCGVVVNHLNASLAFGGEDKTLTARSAQSRRRQMKLQHAKFAETTLHITVGRGQGMGNEVIQDGEIIAPSRPDSSVGASALGRDSGSQGPAGPFFSAEIFDLLRQASANTREIVAKAIWIAGNLNHQQLRVSHILFAMSLTKRGSDLLNREGLEDKKVRRSCWIDFETIDPLPSAPSSVLFSDDVKDVFREALEDVKKREEPDLQFVQVPELFSAITKSPLAGRFRHLFSGQPIPDPILDETRKVVSEIRSSVAKSESRMATIKHLCASILGVIAASGVVIVAGTVYLLLR